MAIGDDSVSEMTDAIDPSMYTDHAWIPKRQLNQYFTKEYYDVFTTVCRTR